MIVRPRASLAFSVLAFTLAASPAAGQVADAWLRYTPIEAYAGARSTRLSAMGGIEVATEDDQSLIDPYRYGRNPAALLASRDTSLIEIPTSYQEFQDRYHGQSHSAVQRGAGLRAELRPSRKWAVGADVDYGAITASRHDLCPSPDDCRFIRDFNLPISPQSGPVTGDRTFGAGVRTPFASLTYARTFFKNVTLGGRFGQRHEEEDRRLADPYDLDLSSDATEFAGGLIYPLPIWRGTISLSAWGQYMSNKVVGRSESPLNDDTYDWDRPQVGYGAALYVRRGAWLRGIIDGRHRSYDGEEITAVNWAPQFFMNPFPSENDPANVFKRRWSAFLSGLRHNEASTRWLVTLPWKPVQVGIRYAYFRQFEWIRPNEVVLPTVDPLDVKRLGYRAAGGLSLALPDGGVVAAEARIAREHRRDFTGELPDISMITYTYHFGSEYPVLSRLPVRAGVELIRHDPDRRDGVPPFKGIGITAGLGYYWDWIDSRVDLSYAHHHFHFSPSDPSEEIGFGDRMSLYIQRLF